MSSKGSLGILTYSNVPGRLPNLVPNTLSDLFGCSSLVRCYYNIFESNNMYNIVQRVHKMKRNSVFLFPFVSAVFNCYTVIRMFSSERCSACALSVTTCAGGLDVLGSNFTCAFFFPFLFQFFFSTSLYRKMP